MESNIDFYRYISGLSNTIKIESNIKENIILLTEKIIVNYQKNIQIAAEQGHKFAYIFIFDKRAKINNISLYDYLFPNEILTQKITSLEIGDIKTSITNKLYPFTILHNNIQIKDREYIALIAKWD